MAITVRKRNIIVNFPMPKGMGDFRISAPTSVMKMTWTIATMPIKTLVAMDTIEPPIINGMKTSA
jgi:hypothetical protein